MIYKYTTCEPIIAKIMADQDISDIGQRTTDIKEWIFEALEKIGAPQQYNHKESNTEDTPVLQIVNYQAQLPSDLVSLEQVACSHFNNGPWRSMWLSTGSFKIKPDKGDEGMGDFTTDESKQGMMNDDDIYPILVQFPTNKNTTNFAVDPQYFLKPGYIVTNIKEGYLKIAYKAIPTDDRGYPLIPDLASYQEAIYWYVMMKLSWPDYYSGKLRSEVYYGIKTSWNFYRKQAYAEAMMPNDDQMTSIKNEWLKLVPEIDEELTFNSNIGKQQKLWNDYYGRIY